MTLARKTPMKRSGFSRKPSPSTSPFQNTADRATGLRWSAIKARVKKPTVAEGSKYLAACRDEPCYLNAVCPWTDWADPTVVPCHSNFGKHGKGGGLKAEHRYSVPGCGRCHEWLDRGPAPYELKVETFDDALFRWEPRRNRKIGIELEQLETEPA